jgi:hypothetical protein
MPEVISTTRTLPSAKINFRRGFYRKEIAASSPVVVQQSSARASPQDNTDDGDGLTQTETQRRAGRMKKATW